VQAWQLFAAAIAVALVIGAALALRKTRRPSQVAFVLLVTPVPTAGLLLFALLPGSPPEVTWLTWISSLLVALGLYPAFYGRRALQEWPSSTLTPVHLTFVNRHVVVARACLVLGISGYVFMFEPWFAVANVAATVIWVAIWIPEGWRLKKYETSAEIRATPEAVFRFLIDTSNWVRYQAGLEAVTATPDGPLTLGSEYTTRRSLVTDPPPLAPVSVEQRFKVIAMTDRSFTAVVPGQQGRAGFELQSVQAATRLTARSEWLLPFSDAILGYALEMEAAIDARRQVMLQDFKRLDELLVGGAPEPARSQ